MAARPDATQPSPFAGLLAALACSCALAVAAPRAGAAAGTGRHAPTPAGLAPGQMDDIDRLTEWPELESKGKADKEVKKLRKARTDEMEAQARGALVDIGAGAAPLLIKALGKERDEDARARIAGVLDLICGDAHTRLLAAEFEHDSVAVRTWALERVAWAGDEGVRAAAEAALERTGKVEDPAPEEAAERFAAALCVTSTGSLAALDLLYERTLEDWAEWSGPIRRALETVRGPAASERFWTIAREGERKERIAAMRMLAGCGEQARARSLKPMLDDSDNSIRVAAINAARGIVDGDPPLEKLATFTAIEMALEWKRRL